MNDPQVLLKQFKALLSEQKFQEAEEMLFEEVYDVEDRMEDISEERYQKIEQHWSAVETGEVISTPVEILYLINKKAKFKTNISFVDLGCGHGFPCIVLGALNPTMHFTGIDLVQEKVEGARKTAEKFGLTNTDFITKDLSVSSYTLPQADYYYIHNPFNDDVCEHVIKSLSFYSASKVISTDGRETKYLQKFGFKPYMEIKPYKIKFYSL